MEILSSRKRRWIWPGLFLLLCICSSAWATGADVTVTNVYRYDGSTPVGNSWLTLTVGSTTVYNNTHNFSAGTFGSAVGFGVSQPVLVTAWDTTSPATGTGDPSKHYGYLSGTTSIAGDPATPISGPITARYRAYRPFDPAITSIVEEKTTTIPGRVATGSLIVKGGQQAPVGGESAEITAYLWKYWKGSDAPTDVTVYPPSRDLEITSATAGTYHFQLALDNQWGDPTAYCSEVTYDFGGTTGGGVTLICNFLTSPPMGVNQFSIPASTSSLMFDGVALTTAPPAKVQNLIDAINAKARAGGSTTDIVNTFGWWNARDQMPVGWTFEGGSWIEQNSPGGAPSAIPLDQDKVYQVSVSAPITFTITGTR